MEYKRSEILTQAGESFINWLFIALISQKGLFNVEPAWKDLPELETFDIKLTIQGVEVDFLKAMYRVDEHIRKMKSGIDKKAEKKAFDLLHEKFGEIIEATQEVLKTTSEEHLAYLIAKNKERFDTSLAEEGGGFIKMPT